MVVSSSTARKKERIQVAATNLVNRKCRRSCPCQLESRIMLGIIDDGAILAKLVMLQKGVHRLKTTSTSTPSCNAGHILQHFYLVQMRDVISFQHTKQAGLMSTILQCIVLFKQLSLISAILLSSCYQNIVGIGKTTN